MNDITTRYTNGEITVVWKPSICMHSRRCFTGLPQVFDPGKRPWVTIQGATSERIMRQIDQCPSGALSYDRSDVEGNGNSLGR
ncbi:(4Fe-4S)-binding protein [Larkinella sp. VNQ87]|uniref:(4Fe-4S)-binding protein n=1 Tax=Larkinella sp. VNQ87 TaxID=3400921 RepID=UPI003BFEE3B6